MKCLSVVTYQYTNTCILNEVEEPTFSGPGSSNDWSESYFNFCFFINRLKGIKRILHPKTPR